MSQPNRTPAPSIHALGGEVLEALLDQLPEGITIVAADGTVVGFNRASMLRDGEAEGRGRFDDRADEFEIRDTSGRVLTADEWPLARALGGERIERFEVTITNLRTRETRLHEIDAAPVVDARGRVTYAIGLRRDVTRDRHELAELERLYASEHVAKQAAERANDLLRRVNVVATELGSVLTPEGVAAAGARLAREAADARGVGIVRLLSDATTLETVGTDGISPHVLEAWRRFTVDDAAPLAECVRADEPVFVSSPTERRTRYLGIADRAKEVESRSWACFPLHQTGLVSGAIGFAFEDVRTFPDTDAAFLSAIAAHVSTALERATLLEDSERARRDAEIAARRLRRLEYVTDAAISDLPFDELLNELLDRVRSALEADSSTLLLLEPDGEHLFVRASRGMRRDPDEEARIVVAAGVSGRILTSARPVIVPELSQLDVATSWLRHGMCSLAGVPLRVRNELVGVLHVATVEPRAFTDDDVQLLQLVGARVASALERAALYGER